ncbi:MAG TPA: glycosyltransferase [Bacteroidales bacterium]|nr:glycosyltransferase [Bacteroidales bacterium]
MEIDGNILFVTEISFYPMFGGERMRSYGLLKILSRTFTHVYAITGLKEPDEFIKEKFPNVTFFYFDFNGLDSKGKVIRTFKRDAGLDGLIQRVIKDNKIDLAFIDYKYYGHYIGSIKHHNIMVVYGTHNVQSRIILQKPYSNLYEYLFLRFYYLLYYLHEKVFFPKADRILAVSEHDAEYYSKFIGESKVINLPNFLDEEIYMGRDVKKEDYIVMTANFIAYQNDVGIRWFLENVWNSELRGRVKLVLAGIGSKEVLAELSKLYDMRNIEALGKQDDLTGIIKNARLAIVPLLDGSGTRLKCIEAMALKTQIISTSMGAEGIDHRGSILIADAPVDFRNEILDVLDKKKDTTERAWEIFMDKYSFSSNHKVFRTMLTDMLD